MDERGVAARLRAEQAAVVQRLVVMDGELTAAADAAAGSNLDDEHDPEGATLAFEREQLAALRAGAERRLRDLDAALDRLAHHGYGRCARCGGEIGADRLDALPATTVCVRCASSGSS